MEKESQMADSHPSWPRCGSCRSVRRQREVAGSWPSHWPVSLKFRQKVTNCTYSPSLASSRFVSQDSHNSVLSLFSLWICPFGLSHVRSGEGWMFSLPSPRFLNAPLISACQSRSWSLAHLQWRGPPELQYPVLISWLTEALAFPVAAWKGKPWWNQKMGRNQLKNSSLVFQRTVPRFSTTTPYFLSKDSPCSQASHCPINRDKINSVPTALFAHFFLP